MSITATSKSNTNYEPLPAGVYVARCYQMIELGTIETPFIDEKTGEKKKQKKVRIGWELPTELKVFKEENGAQPYSISNEYTLSTGDKSNLRKMLEGWRGKNFTEKEAEAFDITKLLGVPCMLSVIHNTKGEKTYANISSVTALPKGMTCPDQINPSFEFSLTEFDEAKFNSLPDWIKDKVKTSDEYKAMTDPTHTDATSSEPPADNNLPF